MKHSDSQNKESFLKEDDIRLAKEWAENLGIPWQTGDGWRAVACRLAHEVERLRMGISNIATLEVCADELTQRKTRDIMKRGYRITGFILLSENGKESCLIDRSAVRWLDEKEWWTLMHPPCTSDPLRLTYDSPNVKDEPRPQGQRTNK